MARIAASSSPRGIVLSMSAFTLDPLGLPNSVAIILLIAIDPIVDPILTALNVHANCAMTVVMAEKKLRNENTAKTQLIIMMPPFNVSMPSPLTVVIGLLASSLVSP